MTYLIKLETCTAWRCIMCLLRVCSAPYCELSAGLSCQAVSSGVAGYSCLPDEPSPTPLPLCPLEVCLVRAASWQEGWLVWCLGKAGCSWRLSSAMMMNVPTRCTKLVLNANRILHAHLYADSLDDSYLVMFAILYVHRDVIVWRITNVIIWLGAGRDQSLHHQVNDVCKVLYVPQ